MKNYTSIYALILGLIIIFSNAQVSSDNNEVSSKILMKQNGEMINLSGTATNKSKIFYELNYVLLVIKQGSTGNMSNNKQQGKFVINPGETKTLSETSVNLKPTDQLKVYLFIRDENKNILIAKDSLKLNVEKKK